MAILGELCRGAPKVPDSPELSLSCPNTVPQEREHSP